MENPLEAVLSFVGGERRNSAQERQSRRQMEFQNRQNRLARQFMERMSNTAVERRVADMRSAGINPILAAGNPASTPGASGAPGAQAQIMDTITPAVATAVQANESYARADLIKEQLKPVIEQIGSVGADSVLKLAQRQLAKMDAAQRVQAIALLEQEVLIASKQAVINDAKAKVILEGLHLLKDTKLGEILE